MDKGNYRWDVDMTDDTGALIATSCSNCGHSTRVTRDFLDAYERGEISSNLCNTCYAFQRKGRKYR